MQIPKEKMMGQKAEKTNDMEQKFQELLAELIILLRDFPGSMSNSEIDQKIQEILLKTPESIEHGVVRIAQKQARVNIVNFKDNSKVLIATGNLWKDRDEDYSILYCQSKDDFVRMEQSGAFENYSGIRAWEDLLSFLKEYGFKAEKLGEEKAGEVLEFPQDEVVNPSVYADKIF